MKKLRQIYKLQYMLHPTVYRTVTKASVSLTLSLLWDRFFNRSGGVRIDYPFTIFGLIFVILGWFSYLSLDGIRFHHLLERLGQKTKVRGSRDIVDYADEKIISFDELDHEEQAACKLVSSLMTGFLLLTLGFAAGVLSL